MIYASEFIETWPVDRGEMENSKGTKMEDWVWEVELEQLCWLVCEDVWGQELWYCVSLSWFQRLHEKDKQENKTKPTKEQRIGLGETFLSQMDLNC